MSPTRRSTTSADMSGDRSPQRSQPGHTQSRSRRHPHSQSPRTPALPGFGVPPPPRHPGQRRCSTSCPPPGPACPGVTSTAPQNPSTGTGWSPTSWCGWTGSCSGFPRRSLPPGGSCSRTHRRRRRRTAHRCHEAQPRKPPLRTPQVCRRPPCKPQLCKPHPCKPPLRTPQECKRPACKPQPRKPQLCKPPPGGRPPCVQGP